METLNIRIKMQNLHYILNKVKQNNWLNMHKVFGIINALNQNR